MPSPDELRDLYGEAYFTGDYDARQNYVTQGDPVGLWEASLGWIERRQGVGTLLDVGAGLGFFVRAAAARGWNALGVEMSNWAAETARERYGANVLAGDLLEIDLEPSQVDVITMWSTLEHVTNPRALLAGSARLLRPGGMLCLGVPNYHGWPVYLRGGRASDFKREHVLYFDFATLKRTLTSEGFREVERMVFWGGTGGSLPQNFAQYGLRRLGLGSQLMVAAAAPV